MGNASSSPQSGPGQRALSPRPPLPPPLPPAAVVPASSPAHPRQASASPGPGNPHHSMREKKKSLELPDLATIARGRTSYLNPPRSAAIAIPTGNNANTAVLTGSAMGMTNGNTRQRAPITLPSNTSVGGYLEGHHPPSKRSSNNSRRSQQKPSEQPPDEKQPFVQETVFSTIPIALTKALHPSEGPPEPVPIKITWRGGGKSVFLARAGDDDWKGRLQMIPESPGSSISHATVALPPGTHHIRFLIDDLWRVADDLPTAVDDNGSLANYVAVPITYSPPVHTNVPASPPTSKKPPAPGQSFWSAASSTDDEPERSRHHHSNSQQQHSKDPLGVWTSVLPPELLEAAREEEAYLAAQEGHQGGSGHHRVQQGFIPAPHIPPAPSLPRHLDKLILNSRIVIGGGAGGAVIGVALPGGGSARRSGTGERDRVVSGGGGERGGAGGGGRSAPSNTVGGRSKGRERERERERDRDRDLRRREREPRERRPPPPPPPPSEAGDWEQEEETTPVMASAIPAVVEEGPGPVEGPTPSSPVPIPASALSALATLVTPTTSALPSTAPTPTTSTPTSTTPIPTSASTPSSRPLSLEANTPALTDDASVLPVPSHVVLHHLSTSAIRNGVLAVASTTRYRKKYLTSVYYKPT